MHILINYAMIHFFILFILTANVLATAQIPRSKSDEMPLTQRRRVGRSKTVPDMRDKDSKYKALFRKRHVPHEPKWLYAHRTIAIGDLHGDLEALHRVLLSTELIDYKGEWTGEDTTVVQTVRLYFKFCVLISQGDIFDRGPSALWIYDLFLRLNSTATQKGGHIELILGNHEVSNMMDQWEEVCQEDIDSFGGEYERHFCLGEYGELGKLLRSMKMVFVQNGNVFAHAG
jgi:hypothetical protein